MTRENPWANCSTTEDIRRRVTQGERPPLTEADNQADQVIVDLMTLCWAQDLWSRPRFADMSQKLADVNVEEGTATTGASGTLKKSTSMTTIKKALPSLPPQRHTPTDTFPVPKPAVPSKPGSPLPTQPKPRIFQAIYDYAATREDELSCKAGEMFIVNKIHNDGWATVTQKDREKAGQGLVPANYLQEVK